MPIISFREAEEILKQYHLPICKTFLVKTEKDALENMQKLTYPVFLKAYGRTIFHRTEIKGVSQLLHNQEELLKTFIDMRKEIKGEEGLLLQEVIEGKELIVGMKRDEQFGPVIMVGIGGIFTEIFQDVSLRVCPVRRSDALAMLEELKAYSYLKGIRGERGINSDTVTEIIVKLSNLAMKEEKIREVDFNPVMANSKEVKIVDFKFIR